MKRLGAVRSHLERNHRLHMVFPHLRKPEESVKWTDHLLTIKRSLVGEKEPSLEARGILSSATGSRATKIYFDDVCDRRNTINQPALRPKVKESFYDVWMNLLDEDGRAVYIFTAWHKRDLSMDLKDNDLWELLQLLIDKDYTPIWEEKWTKKALIRKEKSIGKRSFARGFRGQVLSDDDKTFPSYVLARVRDEVLPVSFIDPTWPIVAGVDLAIGKSKKAKNTVIFPIALDPQGVRYPLLDYVVRGKISSTKTANEIIEMYKALKVMQFFVENNTYQKALLEWIRLIHGPAIPVKGYLTGNQKNDPDVGIPALATGFESGAWKFLFTYRHELSCKCDKCEIFREFEDYPLGIYTDAVMAAWFADRCAVSLGLDVRGIDLSKHREEYEQVAAKDEYDAAPDWDEIPEDFDEDFYGKDM
jgi:hypothetical protein